MEVCVAHVDHVPEGCMIAITAGHSRRLAPLAARQKFAFGPPAANAAAAEGGGGMKVEVLTIQGSTRVDAAKLTPGVLGLEGPAKPQRFEVPLKLTHGSMKVGLTVRPAPHEPGRGKDREAHRLARMASPESEREAMMPVRELKKKPRMIPMEGLSDKEDIGGGSGGGDKASAKKLGPGRHNVALEARTYLEEHRILPFVEEMMRVLVKERPEDPWGCISDLFPMAPKPKPSEAPAPPSGAPPNLQPTEEKVHVRCMPSVGTWMMPLPRRLAKQEAEEEKPQVVAPAAETMKPKPSPRFKGAATPLKGKSLKEMGMTGMKMGGFNIMAFAALEFTLENLVYKEVFKNFGLMQAMIGQVQQTIAFKLGLNASLVEVELGSGSLVVGAKIRQPNETGAEDLKGKIDSDKKGLLQLIESALSGLPALDAVMKPGSKVSGGLGARSMRTFVRQKFMSPEDNVRRPSSVARMTGSTMTPGTTGLSYVADSIAGEEDPSMTMLPEEEQPRSIELPENMVTNGAQVLRKLARQQITGAKRSGDLIEALEAMRKKANDRLMTKTKETLLAALRGGTLGQSLHSAGDIRSKQDEGIREQARAKILGGLEDGSLEAAMEKGFGAPLFAVDLEPAASETAVSGKSFSAEKLRKEVKHILLQSSLNRTFAPTIKDWLVEKDVLLHQPRPQEVLPFKDYYKANFKWGMSAEDSMADLFSQFKPAPRTEEELLKAPPPPPPAHGKMAEEKPTSPAAKRVGAARFKGNNQLEQFGTYLKSHFSQFNRAPGAAPKPKKPKAAPKPPEAPKLPEMPPPEEEREEKMEKAAAPQEPPPMPPMESKAPSIITSEPKSLPNSVLVQPVKPDTPTNSIASGHEDIEDPEEPAQKPFMHIPSVGTWNMVLLPKQEEPVQEPVPQPQPPAPKAAPEAAPRTPEPEPPKLAETGIAVNISVKNVDFGALSSNPTLLANFEAATAKSIAASAGEGILPEMVILSLSAGSVVVDATIVPPADFDISSMESKLTSGGGLGSGLMESLSKVEGIADVASGPLEVSEPQVKRAPTKLAAAKALAQVMKVMKAKKVEEESAKVVDDELQKVAEEEAANSRQFEDEVEAELRVQREQAEEAERRRKAEEEAAAQRIDEELKRKQREDEEEAKRRQQAELEETERKRAESEAAQKLLEEELRKRNEEEEAQRRKQADEEEARRKQEEELIREEAERQKKEAEEAAQNKSAEELEAMKQKAAEEEAAKQKAAEEEAARQKAAEEEAARQKAVDEEEAAKQKAADEQKAAEKEAARQKAAEEEAAKQKAAEEEAAKQKAAEEEAARQKAAEEEAARQKAAEEEAARQKAAAEEAARQKAAEEEAARQRAEEEERQRKIREAEEAERRKKEEEARQLQASETQRAQEALAARIKARQEEEQRKKDEEMKQVAQSLAVFAPSKAVTEVTAFTEGSVAALMPANGGAETPPALKPVSSEDLEEITVGDRVEVINSLYVGQDGMEVCAGWQGSVEEINDGDAVILFYGMDEGRYVLREDFGNLIVMKADPSISSSSADMLANACSEAVNQNEQLRAQNAALRVELDRLLALATPLSTPPLTGASGGSARFPPGPPLQPQYPPSSTG